MSSQYRVVAINGSPHEGFGNTSQMLAMLREDLEQQGLALEEIFLSQHRIEYCAGCGLCLEKGACWIRDDHRVILKKVLEADAVILASPVYFLSVTGRMKTFLDRSVGYGHRPRGDWKPGLAVCVSAGYGETAVGQYLSQVLKAFGAFSVGRFTAIAVSPGQFLGLDAVQDRARDLARDLTRALKEGRRYPATDQDLHYWHFMGNLIKGHRDFMQADFEHWEKLGLFDSFEAYVGQRYTPVTHDEEGRHAWLRDLMDRQRRPSGESGQPEEAAPTPAPADPRSFSTLRELLAALPRVLNPEAAAGLTATYQLEVTGDENFTGHLEIQNGRAAYREGPAARPDVIIRTPADVWLAICKGELNGAMAYMKGKYKVEGKLSLLMKLDSLFGK